MKLALRKQKILAAVIEHYIATGEPIGSKSLQNTEGLDVSSATIRNELADLTVKGFLKQPHTSAGRIPTEYGYRYYVDNLMEPIKLDDRVKRYIENRLLSSSDAPEHIIKTAGAIASELIGTAALSTTPTGDNTRVHRIKFVQTGRHTSMLVLITSSGMVKSRLFRCDFDITPEMLNVFDRALNESLAGQPLSAVNRPFVQTFAASFGELGLLMPDMLTAVMDACKESLGTNVYTSGSTKLLYQNDFDLISARGVLEFLSDSDSRDKLLSGIPEGTTIYIGKENSHVLLRHSAVVATRYEIDNHPAGLMAVIGSTRFDYPKAVAILECIAEYTGSLIDELLSVRQ
ncbi:MAG: heat-inducible transcriptional repressor HrcA [Ruminococcus sp.]|nr:heat-inducible transcriptional repressor HrcA [Ruminococcus sp.]